MIKKTTPKKPVDKYSRKIGKLIKLFRILNGFTEKRAAAKTGISETLYHKYESGEVRMKADILLKICSVLRLPPAKAFDFKSINSHIRNAEFFASVFKDILSIIESSPQLVKVIKFYNESPPNSYIRKIILKLPYMKKETYNKVIKAINESVNS